MMRIKITMLYLVLAAALLLRPADTPACADPPSWDSFKLSTVADIYLTPLPATGVLIYSLSLGPHPTITISGNTYDVDWVQAYFLVSQDESTPIEAANADIVDDWTWELKNTIAGWRGTANGRIGPNQSKVLGYELLNIDDNAVLSGMHVGYQVDSNTQLTGWYKTDLPSSVPEPSSIVALGVAFAACIPVARRRIYTT
ncbi:MAG: hypothetical protein ACYC64_19520 [Armatimonadota bacterium]